MTKRGRLTTREMTSFSLLYKPDPNFLDQIDWS